MTDTESFLSEIMLFLTEKDVGELTEKAGVRFPIVDPTWSDLCYICAWVGLTRKLPESLHNRMLLGEVNEWTKIYSRSSVKFLDSGHFIMDKSVDIDDMWTFAS